MLTDNPLFSTHSNPNEHVFTFFLNITRKTLNVLHNTKGGLGGMSALRRSRLARHGGDVYASRQIMQLASMSALHRSIIGEPRLGGMFFMTLG